VAYRRTQSVARQVICTCHLHEPQTDKVSVLDPIPLRRLSVRCARGCPEKTGAMYSISDIRKRRMKRVSSVPLERSSGVGDEVSDDEGAASGGSGPPRIASAAPSRQPELSTPVSAATCPWMRLFHLLITRAAVPSRGLRVSCHSSARGGCPPRRLANKRVHTHWPIC
jgi:hypothetical protein